MTSTPMRAWVTCRFNESEGATTGREVRRVPGQLGQAAGSLIGLHRDSHRRNRLVCRPLRRRGSRERGGGVGAAGRGSEEWLQARAGGIAGSPQWKAPVSEDVSRAPPSTALLSIRSSPPPTLNGSSSSSSAFSIGRPRSSESSEHTFHYIHLWTTAPTVGRWLTNGGRGKDLRPGSPRPSSPATGMGSHSKRNQHRRGADTS